MLFRGFVRNKLSPVRPLGQFLAQGSTPGFGLGVQGDEKAPKCPKLLGSFSWQERDLSAADSLWGRAGVGV